MFTFTMPSESSLGEAKAGNFHKRKTENGNLKKSIGFHISPFTFHISHFTFHISPFTFHLINYGT